MERSFKFLPMHLVTSLQWLPIILAVSPQLKWLIFYKVLEILIKKSKDRSFSDISEIEERKAEEESSISNARVDETVDNLSTRSGSRSESTS